MENENNKLETISNLFEGNEIGKNFINIVDRIKIIL